MFQNEVSEEVLKELDAEQCNKCQKEFNSAEELKEHVKKVHPGKDEFFCKICDKSFKLKSNVKKHIKNIHGIQEDRKGEFHKKSYKIYKIEFFYLELQSPLRVVHILWRQNFESFF